MSKSGKLYQKGQTLLIVVLVMVVGLTIGLSIVSKSITNVRTTTEEANSAQALAAAEAGVAQAIQTNASISSSMPYSNNSTFTSSLTQTSGQTISPLNNGTIVQKDEGADLWLVEHDPAGVPDFGNPWGGTGMDIYWGDPSASCPNQAALEILLIKGFQNNPTSVRYAVDPCNPRGGTTGNYFVSPTEVSTSPPFSIGSRDFLYRYSISGIDKGLIARVTPIYTNALITAKSSTNFPSQGAVIVSTGRAKDTTIQRKLNVFQGFSYLPIEYVNYGLIVH